jgi:hypothetical protein
LLANGQLLVDSITISVFTIALWLFASLIWTETKYSVLELFSWLSYLLLFMAARTVKTEYIMWLLIPNGVYLSSYQLYLQIKHRNTDWQKKKVGITTFPLFGNSNHNASFMLTSFYAALWLSIYSTPIMWIFTIILGIAIVRTKCRGAIVALFVSLLSFLCMIKSEMIIYTLILLFVLSIPGGKRFLSGSFKDRFDIYIDAIKKIHPRWITGRGLNFFRLTKYGRVHNDIIEIVGEAGLIGLFLFIMLFVQIKFDPVILSCLIAFVIAGMFFYPLREVHTAVPFWIIMGSSASTTNGIAPMYILRGISMLSIFFIMIFVFVVFSNLLNHKGK